MNHMIDSSKTTIARLFPGRRAFDLMVTISLLPLLLPVAGFVALATWVIHGWPLVFVQKRPRFRRQPFALYKSRTMTNACDEAGQLLPYSQRQTCFGRFLRSTSLDELPELRNVLRGEMSLVGPRPLLMEYLDDYTPEPHRQHNVLPGITGWVQVNGRNALTWEQKFSLAL